MAAMRPAGAPPAARLYTVLGVAVAAVSMAAIFIRLADAPGVVVALYRMAIASLVMVPITLRGLRRTPIRGRALAWTVLAGLALAVHFAAWITSLGYTSVAASVTLVATSPLFAALFAWLFLGLAPSLGVMVGVLLAVAGAAVIGFGDLTGGSAPVLGDALALLGAAAAAAYLLLGRAVQRSGVGLDAYAGSAYGVAALVLLPLPWVLGYAYVDYPLASFGWIALLALVPQLVGHTGLNYAARHLDPTLVTTATLLEPVGSGILALALFGEVPGAMTLVGAVILLTGVILTVRSTGGRVAPAPDATGRDPAEPPPPPATALPQADVDGAAARAPDARL